MTRYEALTKLENNKENLDTEVYENAYKFITLFEETNIHKIMNVGIVGHNNENVRIDIRPEDYGKGFKKQITFSLFIATYTVEFDRLDLYFNNALEEDTEIHSIIKTTKKQNFDKAIEVALTLVNTALYEMG